MLEELLEGTTVATVTGYRARSTTRVFGFQPLDSVTALQADRGVLNSRSWVEHKFCSPSYSGAEGEYRMGNASMPVMLTDVPLTLSSIL